MNVVQNFMERLRPLVGPQGWDYCVLWKLSDDQSSVEFVDCVCAGTTIDAQNREELQDSVSLVHPCKDLIFEHLRTKACDLLGKLPSSIPLDSGIYAQVLLSSQPSWCNLPNIEDSGVMDETSGSSVLIPLPGRLIELFTTKQVAEDQRLIDFVTSQFSIAMEQESVLCSSNMDVSFLPVNEKAVNDLVSKVDAGNGDDQMDLSNNFQTRLSQSTSLHNVNLPYDLSVDRIHLCSSSMNMSQQYNCNSEDKAKNDIFYEGSDDIFNSNHSNATNPFNSSLDNALQEIDEMQKTMMNNSGNIHLQYTEPMADQGTEKDVINHETGRSDSISECSDQIDDEDNQKCTTNGKRPQSKNLMAERKRRKKLNDRLYALRALVPNISKLDKASILGDAIKYVKELLKQAKDLQDELEENSDDDDGGGGGRSNQKMQSEILSKDGVVPKAEDDNPSNGCYVGASGNGSINYSKQFQESENVMEKCQEMEPQVEVAQIDGNEFYVKVFCEHRANGFVSLMEALNSLGLEITNVNVTRFRGLVSNVFKVEKKESEFVQADYVRDSLLEVTRNPSRSWMFKSTQGPDTEGGIEFLSHNNHHMSSIHHLRD